MERLFQFRLGPLAGTLAFTPPQRVRAGSAPAEKDRLFSDAIEREIERRELHVA